VNKLKLLMDAIAKREGFGHVGNVPTRMNNPGDLMFANQRYAVPRAVVGRDGKTRIYAQFPSPEDGFFGLEEQIKLDAGRGKTLAQFIAKYAPASDANGTGSYLNFVITALGEKDGSRKLADIIAE
jgi:hypothetical protein